MIATAAAKPTALPNCVVISSEAPTVSVLKPISEPNSASAMRKVTPASRNASTGKRDAGRISGFAASPIAYTFSTSGRPSRPDGMKISTMARMEKAATSLYCAEK